MANITEISDIFLSKYVWFCFIKTCNKPPRRNLGIWIIPQIVPIKILKRQYLPKKIEEKSLTKNLCIEICTKIILYQINLEKHTYSKKYSEEKTFTKNHWREIATKIFPKQISTQKSLKRHSLPTGWKEESVPKENENMFAKISLKTL